jgi:hypothetical protein
MSPSLSDVGVEAANSVAWSIQFFFSLVLPPGRVAHPCAIASCKGGAQKNYQPHQPEVGLLYWFPPNLRK